MQINIRNLIKDEIIPLDLKLKFEVPKGYGLSSSEAEVCFKGKVYGKGDLFVLEGQIFAEVLKPCDRCLTDTLIKLNETIFEQFKQTEETGDFISFQGEIIDLDEAVFTNFLLNIPIKALCKEDCKGLCPVCGLNLNDGECLCKDNKESKFDVLRSLFKDDAHVNTD